MLIALPPVSDVRHSSMSPPAPCSPLSLTMPLYEASQLPRDRRVDLEPVAEHVWRDEAQRRETAQDR